jgi:membrane-bound lytic murein transglycosylase B
MPISFISTGDGGPVPGTGKARDRDYYKGSELGTPLSKCQRMKRDVIGPTILFCALLFLVCSPAGAQRQDQFGTLKNRLVDDGFEYSWIEGIYAAPSVRFDTDTASLYFRHKESRLDYDQFATADSIRKARAYLNTHAKAFDRAEKKYGVDREIIAAILLVETRLGTYTGRRPILNTLSTLSALGDSGVRDDFWKSMPKTKGSNRKQFDSWARGKSGWAYRELKAFFELALREGFDPVEVSGSYAGALGIAQFMPSSALDYARDGNRDGEIDLFVHADAIASVGSYLKRNGWRPGMDRKRAGKVIYRYNHSPYYVEAILEIADSLRSGTG